MQVDNEKIEPFLDTINEKLEGLSREQLIKQFVSAEFNRFVSYYKNARDININSKDSRDGGGRKNRSNRDRSRNSRDKSRNNKDRSSRVKFSRFHINVGSKNNVNPVKLIGLINDNLKSKNMVSKKAVTAISRVVREETAAALTQKLQGNIWATPSRASPNG